MSPGRGSVSDQAARLRALHGAALALGAHVADEPSAVARMLTGIVDQAATAIGGRDGLLILADSPAWANLPAGARPGDGNLILWTGGQMSRRPLRSDGVSAYALRSGQLATVPDTSVAEGFGPYPDLVERGIRSLAIVPLRAGGEVLGALSLGFDWAGVLDQANRELIELFAAHAAAAIERLRLVDAERRQATAFARQTEELTRRESEATALRELDKLKNEFLASISHELRTPLTVILGYAEILQTGGTKVPPATIATMTHEMLIGARRLTELVDNLLDFSRMQRGEVAIQPVVYDLVPDLEGSIAEHRLKPGGNRIRLEAPPRLTVMADRGRLLVAVGHLIGNALRYAPTGPILVRLSAVDGAVRVEVRDEGPGIPAGEQARLWEKFYRGTGVAGLNVQPGGGMGLALVKALAEAHGGRVGVESRRGHGARFWIELPLPVG